MRKGQESEVHTFEGGMNTDDDLTVLKPNQYRWAVNATLSNDVRGSSGVLTGYNGSTFKFDLNKMLTGGFKILYSLTISLSEPLSNDIPNAMFGVQQSTGRNTCLQPGQRNFLVVFALGLTSNAERIWAIALDEKFDIVTFTNECCYVTVFSNEGNSGVSMGWDSDTQISASFDYMTLYFTTGKTSIMNIDFTQLKRLYDAKYNLDAFNIEETFQPEISYTQIVPDGGQFEVGAYQWCYYYYRRGGIQESMSHPSELIGLRKYKYSYYAPDGMDISFYNHGLKEKCAVSCVAGKAGEISPHSVTLEIPVNPAFDSEKDFIRLYRIFYANQTAPPKFTLVEELKVADLKAKKVGDYSSYLNGGNGRGMVYTYSDLGGGSPIDSLEFTKKEQKVVISKAGTVAIKDDRLYAANVKYADSENYTDLLKSEFQLVPHNWSIPEAAGSRDSGICVNNLFPPSGTGKNWVFGVPGNCAYTWNWNCTGLENRYPEGSWTFKKTPSSGGNTNTFVTEHCIFNMMPPDTFKYTNSTAPNILEWMLALPSLYPSKPTNVGILARFGSFGSFLNYRHCFRSAYYQSGETYMFGVVYFFKDGTHTSVLNTVQFKSDDNYLENGFLWRGKMRAIYPTYDLKYKSNAALTISKLKEYGVVAVKPVRCRREPKHQRCMWMAIGNNALYCSGDPSKNENALVSYGYPGRESCAHKAPSGSIIFSTSTGATNAPALWAPLFCDGVKGSYDWNTPNRSWYARSVVGVICFYNQDTRYFRERYGEGYWTQYNLKLFKYCALFTGNAHNCFCGAAKTYGGKDVGSTNHNVTAASYKFFCGSTSMGDLEFDGRDDNASGWSMFIGSRGNAIFSSADQYRWSSHAHTGVINIFDTASTTATTDGNNSTWKLFEIAELKAPAMWQQVTLSTLNMIFFPYTSTPWSDWYSTASFHNIDWGVASNMSMHFCHGRRAFLNCYGDFPEGLVVVVRDSHIQNPLADPQAPQSQSVITTGSLAYICQASSDRANYYTLTGSGWGSSQYYGVCSYYNNGHIGTAIKWDTAGCIYNYSVIGDIDHNPPMDAATSSNRRDYSIAVFNQKNRIFEEDGLWNNLYVPTCSVELFKFIKPNSPYSNSEAWISCGNALPIESNYPNSEFIVIGMRFGDTYYGTNAPLVSCYPLGDWYSRPDTCWSYHVCSTATCYPYEARHNPYWRETLNVQALGLAAVDGSDSKPINPAWLQLYPGGGHPSAASKWTPPTNEDYGKNVLDLFTECGAMTYSTVAESTDTKPLRTGGNRIVVSMSSNTNSSNSKLQFEQGKFIDVDNSYGIIERLFIYNGKLHFFQTNAFGVVHSMERAAVSDTGMGAVSIGKGDVLTGFDYISTEYGCDRWNKMAIINNTLFFVDTKNKNVLMYDGKQIVDLFDKCKISREKKYNFFGQDVSIGGNDQRILFCLNDRGTYVYNIALNVFESVISISKPDATSQTPTQKPTPPPATAAPSDPYATPDPGSGTGDPMFPTPTVPPKPSSNYFKVIKPSTMLTFIQGLAQIYYITKGCAYNTQTIKDDTLKVYTMFTAINNVYPYVEGSVNLFTQYCYKNSNGNGAVFNDRSMIIDFVFNNNPTKNKVFESLIVNAATNVIQPVEYGVKGYGVQDDWLSDDNAKDSFLFDVVSLRVPYFAREGTLSVDNYTEYVYGSNLTPRVFRRFGSSYIMQIIAAASYKGVVTSKKFSMPKIGLTTNRVVGPYLIARMAYDTTIKKAPMNLYSVQLNYVTDKRITL